MARNDRVVRLLKLARILADSRRGLPVRRLADRLERPLRTLYRDLDALEDSGFPLIREEGRVRLPAESFRVPESQLQPDERIALFTMLQLGDGLRETASGRALDRLWRRLSGARPDQPLLLPTDPIPTIALRSPLAIDYRAHRRTISTIEEAIASRRVLRCRYEAASTAEVTTRVIEPAQLHWDPALESMYAIAYCRLRKAVRVFAVHRFQLAAVGIETFRPRAEVASTTALRDAFRVWRGANIERVTIRFSGWAARDLRERKVHASQVTTRVSRDITRISLEVAGFEEVTRWILSYGPLAVVESPAPLADRIHEELIHTLSPYQAKDQRATKIMADNA